MWQLQQVNDMYNIPFHVLPWYLRNQFNQSDIFTTNFTYFNDFKQEFLNQF